MMASSGLYWSKLTMVQPRWTLSLATRYVVTIRHYKIHRTLSLATRCVIAIRHYKIQRTLSLATRCAVAMRQEGKSIDVIVLLDLFLFRFSSIFCLSRVVDKAGYMSAFYCMSLDLLPLSCAMPD